MSLMVSVIENGISLHLKLVEGVKEPKSNYVRLKIWKYVLCLAFKFISIYNKDVLLAKSANRMPKRGLK